MARRDDLENHDTITKPRRAFHVGMRVCAGILAFLPLLTAAPVRGEGITLSGESTTIFRLRESIDKKNIAPAYEFLRLSLTDLDKDGRLSFFFGGWGRTDLGARSTDKFQDGDLQYGYVSYRSPKNNLLINAGRQFISEGVAAEKFDGLYLRNDFAAGIGAAAFVGKPVITEPSYDGGSVVYGTRLSQSMQNYYTVGVSVLKSERESGTRYREEEGLDLWLHPVQQFDLVGRSSYNSITSGWMEHTYSASYTPLSNLRFGADLSVINYKDYLFNLTTRALSLNNGIITPNERLTAAGAAIAYNPLAELTIIVDYKNYGYRYAGSADYFGGKAVYSKPESFSAGFAVHRMEGVSDRLRYSEYRLFATKKLGHADFAVDATNINYASRINGVKNSFAVTGAGGYEISPALKVGLDMEYSKNPDFNNELRGLVKITYLFNVKRREGGSKSEK